jgi:hypothetical protein
MELLNTKPPKSTTLITGTSSDKALAWRRLSGSLRPSFNTASTHQQSNITEFCGKSLANEALQHCGDFIAEFSH